MKNIMVDMTAKNCWSAIHGQEEPCMWCKAPSLLKKAQEEMSIVENQIDSNYAIYEQFNENANKWFQVQEKVTTLNDGRTVLISFSLDISTQKEAQSKLIDTHVKLTNQTIALEEAKEKLKEQANRDPLTNMYNRRYFSDISKSMLALSIRSKQALSVMMIDIDKFKNINDTYGHAVGDKVLIHLSHTLTNTIRESDISARFGGEEFAILLPKTTLEQALELAEKIRKTIEKLEYKGENTTIKFTISIGVSEFNKLKEISISDTLNKADKSLYEAKNNGRNQVKSSL